MVWGTFLRYIKDQVGEYEALAGKIRGQVWDSPFFEAERIPEVGGSVLSPGNQAVQSMLKFYATWGFYNLRNKSSFFLTVPVLDYFIRAVANAVENRKCSEAFENTNFNSPYLVICSVEDPIALCQRVAACAKIWREKGCVVSPNPLLLYMIKAWCVIPEMQRDAGILETVGNFSACGSHEAESRGVSSTMVAVFGENWLAHVKFGLTKPSTLSDNSFLQQQRSYGNGAWSHDHKFAKGKMASLHMYKLFSLLQRWCRGVNI